MTTNYILVDRVPTPCDDVLAWAMWYGKADRTVRKSKINGVEVSTVFLGMNYGFMPGERIFFETMVFGGQFDANIWRCETWDQAEAQHKKVCELVKGINQN